VIIKNLLTVPPDSKASKMRKRSTKMAIHRLAKQIDVKYLLSQKAKANSLYLMVGGIIIAFVISLFPNSVIYNNYSAFAHHVIGQVPVTSRPMGLSLADDAQLLYVSNMGKPIVSIINTTSDKVTGEINSSTTGGVMAVDAIPQKVYVAPFEAGVLEVYDAHTRGLIKTIPLPGAEIAFPQPPGDRFLGSVSLLSGGWALDYDHNNQMLYVANYNKDQIVIVDTRTDKIVGTIPVPAHPIDVKVDPDSDVLLVASLAGNGLTFISTKTNQILNTISTGSGPWGLDIDSKEKIAYVTNRGNNYVTVVDIPTQRIIAKVPISGPAQAITVDDNEHMIYASYMDQPKIVKIDGNTNTVIDTIDMTTTTTTVMLGQTAAESIPQAIVADPNSHKLYVSIKNADTVYVLGPRAISKTIPVVTKGIPALLIAGNITAHGQDVQVSDPFIDIKTKSLTMKVASPDGGDLALRIPISLLDAKDTNGNSADFKLSIDGKPTTYQEQKFKKGAGYREITFFVPKDSKVLDIVGTETVSLMINGTK
jgi:YVTN family beta-propeller protein